MRSIGRIGAAPEIAVVLGSGLGDFAGTLGDAVSMPYADLPNWPVSRVVGHAGRLVVGRLGARRVAALAGPMSRLRGARPPDGDLRGPGAGVDRA